MLKKIFSLLLCLIPLTYLATIISIPFYKTLISQKYKKYSSKVENGLTIDNIYVNKLSCKGLLNKKCDYEVLIKFSLKEDIFVLKLNTLISKNILIRKCHGKSCIYLNFSMMKELKKLYMDQYIVLDFNKNNFINEKREMDIKYSILDSQKKCITKIYIDKINVFKDAFFDKRKCLSFKKIN